MIVIKVSNIPFKPGYISGRDLEDFSLQFEFEFLVKIYGYIIWVWILENSLLTIKRFILFKSIFFNTWIRVNRYPIDKMFETDKILMHF